jgi:hypothetical protein
MILGNQSQSLIECYENRLNNLGYIVKTNDIKELMEADIVLYEDNGETNSIAELGIAYGDFLFRQLKTIIVVGKLPALINAEHVKVFKSVSQALVEYFTPNGPVNKGPSPDLTSILKYLSLALYPYLVPEIGESISIELKEEDINAMSEKVAVRIEKKDKSLVLQYKERFKD